MTTLNSSGVVFGNSLTQLYPAPAASGQSYSENLGTTSGDPFGYGWTNGNNQRVINVTYTNSTGRPLIWYFGGQNDNGSPQCLINGITVRNYNGYGTTGGFMIIVPPGATYMLRRGPNYNSNIWYEY
jgi:hypothetical protein